MKSATRNEQWIGMSKRVEALQRELGYVVDPAKLGTSIRPVSLRDFLKHLAMLAMKVPSVDTSKPGSLYTKLFLVALYAKPPRLAFVEAKLSKGLGRVRVVSESGKVVEMVFDRASRVIGPRSRVVGHEQHRIVFGYYVPIAASYVVTNREVEGATPLHRVTDGKRGTLWYVYRSSGNPIPHNVALILSL